MRWALPLTLALSLAGIASANIYVDNTPRGIYCIGDSMTSNWPDDLPAIIEADRHAYGSGVGGTQSWEQVRTLNGVFITYPQSGSDPTPDTWYPADDSISAGTVTINLRRHIVKTSYNSAPGALSRAQIVERVQKVINPSRVLIYDNGRYIGEATHNTLTVTTDYGTDINRIYATAHGLSDGDKVFFWVEDPLRPAQPSNLEYFESADRPSALMEYKAYEVVNATADSFEVYEYDGDSSPLDLGSDATATLTCETGWSLDWEYGGGDWSLSIRTISPVSDHIWAIQTTTNDVIVGDPGDDYQRWPTHTLPAIEYLMETQTAYPKRFVYVTPTRSAGPETGDPGSDNQLWIDNVVRVWADALAAANSNFLYVDPYRLADSLDVRLAEEKALLANPLVAEKLWISGDPHTPAGWAANATEQGGDYERWVGPGYLPLHFRAGNNFSDSGHWDDDDGAEWLAEQVFTAIQNVGW